MQPKEPTALTMMQVAQGCINYATQCVREGDAHDAKRYIQKGEEALLKAMYLMEPKTIEKPDTSL